MDIHIHLDLESLKGLGRRLVATRLRKAAVLVTVCAAPLLVYAATTKPYTFSDGQAVSAAQVNANFDALFTAVNSLETRVASSGTIYVRWGRTTCPSTATLVYKGYTAGHNYTHGSGANTLCLSESPTWDQYSDGNQNGGLIYGMEYETSGYGLSYFNSGFQDYEAPCAVCLVTERSVQFMLPGRNTCPTGWTTEYQGYLMSTHYTHATSEFVCVDRQAEKIGSSSNHNGNLWYPVEAECGSLPCLPYVQDRELTCAICTR